MGFCLNFCGVLAVAVGVWIAYSMNKDFTRQPLILQNGEWNDWTKSGFPTCERPIIIRDVFKFGDTTAANGCRDLDTCMKLTHQKIIEVFGENQIVVYPVAELCKVNPNGQRHSGAKNTTLKDFMDDPKYNLHMIPAMRLGTVEQYKQFFESYGGHKDQGIFNSWDTILNIPGHQYMGTQVFVARGNETGSHMHWAWGLNLFVLLSGSKRWMHIPPKYHATLGCNFVSSGIHGTCYPNGYTGSHWANESKVNFQEYVDAAVAAGVPREEILVYDVKAGDIAFECDVWPHAVMNLEPETVAFTIRYKKKAPWEMIWDLYHVKVLMKSLAVSIRTMTTDPSVFTVLHGLFSDQPSLDTDPRMQVNSILDPNNKKA